MHKVQRYLVQCLFQVLARIPLRMARLLGSWIGMIMWLTNSRAAQVTKRNLTLCFPALDEAERETIAKHSLQETSKTGLEMASIWIRPYRELRKKIFSIHGASLFNKARADGRGLIILAPHLGNWEVVGLYLSEVGRVTSLYQPPKQKVLEELIKSGRTKLGAHLVPTNQQGVRALFKALHNGEMLGILPDQEPELSGGIFAPFFDISALTMKLAHGLISRTNCHVLLCYAQRVPGGFDLVFCEPRAGIYLSDEKEAVTAMNLSIEDCVRRIPEQYQWEYKRFKKRPGTEAKVY